MDPRIQLPLATGLVTSPWWTQLLDLAHKGFAALAAFFGAVIGALTLYRMWKNRRDSS